MESAVLKSVRSFRTFLLGLCNEEKKGKLKDPVLFEDDVQVHIVDEVNKSPLCAFWKENASVFIAEKAPPKEDEADMDTSVDNETSKATSSKLEDVSPLPLPSMKARQLASWYTLGHNLHLSEFINDSVPTALPMLWVRCDGSDPEGTVWFGAEPVKTGKDITSMVFHTITCSGPIVDKSSFTTLENLKIAHKDRHLCSAVTTKGYARYDLFGASILENTITEPQSSIIVDLTWNTVVKILEVPPLTSVATLNIKVEPGDPRSPVFQIYKELEFLLVLAKGLKTGETEWPEVLEEKTAVEAVQELIEDVKNQITVSQHQPERTNIEKLKSDEAAVESTIHSSFVPERGDLDFAEQLWTRMRKTVSSYQDVVDCLTLVIRHLQSKDIQPWIHQGSNSSLSKLIQQSYRSAMPTVSVNGLAAIRMLLELGLDKLRRDYINYFIGQELTTLNYLDYFINSTVNFEDQILRLQKLHHMLELVVSCNAFLTLSHENLFALTQSCSKYYKDNPLDEHHVFQLPIRPMAINAFFENEHPIMWRMEIISGHGQKELKTIWQLNTRPPVDHMTFTNPDLPIDDISLNADYEETFYYNTVIRCSQAHSM
ncbi:protein zwilch homolog [Hypanus sabinus]|uniref:protein zwilch homolog n=1 Tax=Hypanus sabinus TaxID=79690 RepID=UPI0028C4A884|nr:protein zwilch homolog [Hypanus sabinus]XP_059809050.1 protein zwilch homolog [Hypanus sabinus]XP_059809051.1 protein zwilch homolog [Hypanus sabinus]XP_059809052.1 protein zwilch homolog [Hypanus sabinus]